MPEVHHGVGTTAAEGGAAPRKEYAMVDTAKARVVTVVASSEYVERIVGALQNLGARGFTQMQVSGRGLHGPRTRSALDSGNIRLETIVTPAVAEKILDHIAREYAGFEIIGFAYDVDAVPRAHFS
jgi:nitrogen regulatory protein PII